MTRRDWWLGIMLLTVGLALHATLPRYEWQTYGHRMIRTDTWTGSAQLGEWRDGRWAPLK